MKGCLIHAGLGVWLLVATIPAGAVSYDQVDDFQGGSKEGWDGGKSVPPVNIADGGPGGQSDRYLQIQSSSFHLGMYNASQWTGDYIRAGVEGIELDVIDQSLVNNNIHLRFLLFGPGGTFATIGRMPIIMTNSWTRYSLSLCESNLVHVSGGTGVAADTLRDVGKLLLRHDTEVPTTPSNHPPHITSMIGIDNIHAIPQQPVFLGFNFDSNNIVEIIMTSVVEGVTGQVEIATNVWQGADRWVTSGVVVATSSVFSLDTENIGAPVFFRVRIGD